MYFEKKINSTYPRLIIGCDEAGRGPLAGPVVVASVGYFAQSENDLLSVLKFLKKMGVGDSKKIQSEFRQKIIEKLTPKLNELKLEVRIEVVDPQTIDKINILQASLLGMKLSSEAVHQFFSNSQDSLVLLDGNKKFIHDSTMEVISVIKGDEKSLLIGLASIFAKEKRDEIMVEFDRQYPQYGFKNHYGYATKEHQSNLQIHGASPIHRKSFRLDYSEGLEI